MEIGDLLWVKQKGFPSWPAIAYPRSGKSTCLRVKDGKLTIFVKFIDEIPSCAYIEPQDAKPFESARRREYLDPNGELFSRYPGWYDAVQFGLNFLAPIQTAADRINRIDKLADGMRRNPTGVKKSDSLKKRFGPKFCLNYPQGYYCYCETRIEQSDLKNPKDKLMVPCCVCENYYHLSCLDLLEFPKNAFDCWVCNNCGESFNPPIVDDQSIDQLSDEESILHTAEKPNEPKSREKLDTKEPEPIRLDQYDTVNRSNINLESVPTGAVVGSNKQPILCKVHQAQLSTDSKKRLTLVERKKLMSSDELDQARSNLFASGDCQDCRSARLHELQRQCVEVNKDLVCEDILTPEEQKFLDANPKAMKDIRLMSINRRYF